MVRFILALLTALRVFFRSRGNTALEILALRQQVAVRKGIEVELGWRGSAICPQARRGRHSERLSVRQ